MVRIVSGAAINDSRVRPVGGEARIELATNSMAGLFGWTIKWVIHHSTPSGIAPEHCL